MTASEAKSCEARLIRAGAERVGRMKFETEPGVDLSRGSHGVEAVVTIRGRGRERSFWNVSDVTEYLETLS